MDPIRTIGDRMQITPRLAGRSKDELARIAYEAVEGIEFLEMNDGNRLGYHLYLYLTGEIPSVETVIYEAKARTRVHPVELERLLVERLKQVGVNEG
jgi:hypothetical protein